MSRGPLSLASRCAAAVGGAARGITAAAPPLQHSSHTPTQHGFACRILSSDACTANTHGCDAAHPLHSPAHTRHDTTRARCCSFVGWQLACSAWRWHDSGSANSAACTHRSWPQSHTGTCCDSLRGVGVPAASHAQQTGPASSSAPHTTASSLSSLHAHMHAGLHCGSCCSISNCCCATDACGQVSPRDPGALHACPCCSLCACPPARLPVCCHGRQGRLACTAATIAALPQLS